MKNKTDKKESLDNSLKLLVRTSFIVFIGIVISKIVTYFYRIIIARHLGPEIYGIFSLASMIFGWFAAIFSFGLADGLLRYVSIYRAKEDNGEINYITKKTLLILSISSIFATLLLFLSSEFISINFFHNSELIIYLKIFSIALPFWIFSSIFLSIMRAYQRISAYSMIFNIIQNVSKLAVLILLVFMGLKDMAVIFSFTIGTMMILLCSYIYCKKNFPEVMKVSNFNKEGKQLFKELVYYSGPIMFFGVISSLFYWIDSFSLGYFKGVMEVGFYNAAMPIASLLTLSSEVFTQLFFPLVTKYYSEKNFSLINDVSKQVGKWVWIINLPALALLILFPGVFINILFGKEYLVAENALRFLAIGSFFFSLFSISNNLLFMIGKSKLILFDITIASLVNLILNFILIPMQTIFFLNNSNGITGAAIATMISIAFFNLLMMFQIKHYLSIIPFKREMIKIFFITLILIIPLYIISSLVQVSTIGLFIIGIIFIVTYLVLILITGCLDKSDFMIIKAIWRKIFRK